jgi:hypothetical protein
MSPQIIPLQSEDSAISMAGIDLLFERVKRGFLRRRFAGEIYDYARDIGELGPGYTGDWRLTNVCRNCAARGIPQCGHFEIETARHLIGPFKAILDPNVRVVMVLKAAQTAGSLVWDLAVHFLLVHSPYMRIKVLLDSDEKARAYCTQRLMETLRRNPDISPLLPTGADRFGVTDTEMRLLNGKTLFVGGLNDRNASSLGSDVMILDEGWLHEADGLMKKAFDRLKQTKHGKIIIVGQAGNVKDDQDSIWESLHARIPLTWACPCCGGRQQFELHKKRADDFVPRLQPQMGTDETQIQIPFPKEQPKPGTYVGFKIARKISELTTPEEIKAACADTRIECYWCGFEIPDTREMRQALNASYEQAYQLRAADGTPYTPKDYTVGFWQPDPASMNVPFSRTMEKYVHAVKAREEFKNEVPIRDFYLSSWARPFDPNLVRVIRARAQEKYDIQSDWPEEWKGRRCFIIDCQYELQHFWGSVHAVSRTGKSRQLWRGLLRTFGAKDDKMPMIGDKIDAGRVDSAPPTICAVQKHFGVLDQCVFLDGAYMTNELVNECSRHGHWGKIDGERTWLCWTLLLGSAQKDFSHKEDKNFKLRHPVSDAFYEPANLRVDKQVVDVEMFYFSALQMSQMAARYRDGNSPETLFLDEQEPPVNGVYPPLSWTAQIHAVTPHFEPNKRTGEAREEIWKPEKQSVPHHYFDVLKMLCTVLTVWGISGERPFTEHPVAEKVSATDS